MSTIRRKIIFLAVALLSLAVFFGYMKYRESRTCMGVRVVSDEILDPLTEDPNMDISEILIDGKRIGGGRELSTIFVSQPEENCGCFSWFRGELTLSRRGLKLYFLKNAALQDVPHYHSRVNAIQQHMDLFLIKPGFRNGWHPAEADVCLKQFPQIHHLSLFVNGPLPLAACGRLI